MIYLYKYISIFIIYLVKYLVKTDSNHQLSQSINYLLRETGTDVPSRQHHLIQSGKDDGWIDGHFAYLR